MYFLCKGGIKMKKEYIYGIKGLLYVTILSFLLYWPKIFFSLDDKEFSFPGKDVVYVVTTSMLFVYVEKLNDKLNVLKKEKSKPIP